MGLTIIARVPAGLRPCNTGTSRVQGLKSRETRGFVIDRVQQPRGELMGLNAFSFMTVYGNS